jgi:hypothetical protein
MHRRYLAIGLVLLGLVGAAPAAGGTSTPVAGAAKVCRGSGDVKGTIGGAQKCLHAGEFCAHRYASQYRRYGFTCALKNGRYRLR